MSGYTQGREVEYAVIHELTDLGWLCTRGASSKGVADVIAIGPTSPYGTSDQFMRAADVALINVKRTTQPGPLERHRLIAAADRSPGMLLPVVAIGPASHVTYRLLTGLGPKDWIEWEPA